ncbi:MAG: anthranilate synthase component I [Bacillota bacterium]
MLQPELSIYRQLASEGGIIPVYADVIADNQTPIALYRRLRDDSPSYLLESISGGDQIARYSFVGIDPFATLTVTGEQIATTGPLTIGLEGNPFDVLRDWTTQFAPGPNTRAFAERHLPPFFGGAVGFLGYEMVSHIENIPIPPPGEVTLPDAQFMMTRVVAAFDHATNRLKLIVNTLPGEDPQRDYRRAEDEVRRLLDRIAEPLDSGEPLTASPPADIVSSSTRERFTAAVERAREYIRSGDIFQAVLSQRFEAPLRSTSLQVYRHLRSMNPSPYMFHLDLPDLTMVGASPEVLVRVVDGNVEVRPLAGTRRRGRNEDEDRALEMELKTDEKERAEHVMLLDLGRNDVGRVARYGSVKVSEMLEIERYSHVMHLVSHVEAKLRDGLDAIDALKACFPAGTLSGAPKVRAMEIIAELEPHRRGPYGGTVGYFGFSGNLDSCITIRTVVIKDDRAYIQAGAGIVADSEPDKEFEETLNKAAGLLRALEQAERSVLP